MTNLESYTRFKSLYESENPPPWDSGIVPPEVRALVETLHILPGQALDVGCGTGTSSIYLALHGWRVTGVDFIADAVARARAKAAQEGLTAAQCCFEQADVSSPDFLRDHASVHLWLDVGCLHGFSETERQTYATHVKRLLGEGGIMRIYGWQPHERNGQRIGFREDNIQALFSPDIQLIEAVYGQEATNTSIGSAWYTLQRSIMPGSFHHSSDIEDR